MGHSGAGGKLIHKKNPKQKISWHCPFNVQYVAWISEFPTKEDYFQQ